MIDISNILYALSGIVGGGGITSIFLLKYKKKENRESANEKEINNLRILIKEHRDEIDRFNVKVDRYEKKIEDLEKKIDNQYAIIIQKETENFELRDKINVIETKHYLNKGVINQALSCAVFEKMSKFCKEHNLEMYEIPECPVLTKKKLNDEEYLKRINHYESNK